MSVLVATSRLFSACRPRRGYSRCIVVASLGSRGLPELQLLDSGAHVQWLWGAGWVAFGHCGIFPDQGSNPQPLHGKRDFLTTGSPGSPSLCLLYTIILGRRKGRSHIIFSEMPPTWPVPETSPPITSFSPSNQGFCWPLVDLRSKLRQQHCPDNTRQGTESFYTKSL